MRRVVALAALMASLAVAAAPADARWSFGVSGFTAPDGAFTPLAAQYTFDDRALCHRMLNGLRELGYVVLGAPVPALPSQSPLACWPNGVAVDATPEPAPGVHAPR